MWAHNLLLGFWVPANQPYIKLFSGTCQSSFTIANASVTFQEMQSFYLTTSRSCWRCVSVNFSVGLNYADIYECVFSHIFLFRQRPFQWYLARWVVFLDRVLKFMNYFSSSDSQAKNYRRFVIDAAKYVIGNLQAPCQVRIWQILGAGICCSVPRKKVALI